MLTSVAISMDNFRRLFQRIAVIRMKNPVKHGFVVENKIIYRAVVCFDCGLVKK